jgi:hypothetical protein
MVAEFIRKCIGDVVPMGMIKTYPNKIVDRWQHSCKTKCEPPHLTIARAR